MLLLFWMRKNTHFGGNEVLWHEKIPTIIMTVGIHTFYFANSLFGNLAFDRKDGDEGLTFSLLLEFNHTVA